MGIFVALKIPMLHLVSRLRGASVHATDGEIGTIEDLYFDDEQWTVRFVVVSTGAWLGRSVLLSPISVEEGWTPGRVHVKLTRRQVEDSPDAATHEPVSRRLERELLRHYGYPIYWGGTGVWGAYGIPAALMGAAAEPIARPVPPAPSGDVRAENVVEETDDEDRHLRSAAHVIGFHVEATDGGIGHVDDFLVDDRSWQIRYVQLDTSNWIGGKAVAVSPKVLRGIDHAGRSVKVAVSRDAVKAAPPLDSIDLPPAELAPPFVII
jgi:hypothetical protein